jgi:hypothetical protein
MPIITYTWIVSVLNVACLTGLTIFIVYHLFLLYNRVPGTMPLRTVPRQKERIPSFLLPEENFPREKEIHPILEHCPLQHQNSVTLIGPLYKPLRIKTCSRRRRVTLITHSLVGGRGQ